MGIAALGIPVILLTVRKRFDNCLQGDLWEVEGAEVGVALADMMVAHTEVMVANKWTRFVPSAVRKAILWETCLRSYMFHFLRSESQCSNFCAHQQMHIVQSEAVLLPCRGSMDAGAVGLEVAWLAVVGEEASAVATMAMACQLDTMMHALRMGN